MLIYFAFSFMILIGALSARQLLEACKMWTSGLQSKAIVIEMDPTINESNCPVVRFSDATGKTYVVPIFIGGLNLKVGDSVQLMYFPAAPDKAKLAEPISFILPALGLIGAVFVGFELFLTRA